MKRFENKTAIVTGSTRGIGAGIIRRLADEGASVVVAGRSVHDGNEVVNSVRDENCEAEFVQTNVRNVEDIRTLVKATIERFGSLDVLVNNAAVQTETGADELTIEQWNRVIETDFRAYWLCAKLAFKRMDHGAIVNISSNHAHQTMPKMFPYNAIKAGISGMTRAMALDFGPQVRVNSVDPGWVAVDRTVGEMRENQRAELASKHPVGRIGEPSDIAAAVAYLASEEAGFVNGANLVIDGGRTVVMQDDTLPDYRARREDN
jgi:NAD(P)-dependent dehydrogenase (short-subunit alcohol dehydrogenase family)